MDWCPIGAKLPCNPANRDEENSRPKFDLFPVYNIRVIWRVLLDGSLNPRVGGSSPPRPTNRIGHFGIAGVPDLAFRPRIGHQLVTNHSTLRRLKP